MSLSQSVSTNEPTAFALARAGDKLISPKAADKITGIYSEKSSGANGPEIWHIDYFDPKATWKDTQVTFVNGRVKEVTQPKRLFDLVAGGKQMSWRKLKIDSDRALSIAARALTLRKLRVAGEQYWLDKTPAGPRWKIRLWVSSADKPNETNEIGDLYIATQTGEIVKDDLREPDPK